MGFDMLPVSSTSGDKSAPDELRRFKLNSDSMSWSTSMDGEHARLLNDQKKWNTEEAKQLNFEISNCGEYS